MSEQTLNLPTDAPAPAGAPRWGGLLRSELRRARSRRSVRWMTLLLVLGVVAVSAIIFATTASVDADDLERAAARSMAEQQKYYEDCMADPSIPQDDKEQYCWKPTEQDIRANAFWNLDKQPFTNDSMTGLLIFAGGIAAVVALLMGASAGGADWGARTMGLLFSWEPRRLRVFLTRLIVVLVTGLVITAIAVAIAWALGSLIAGAHSMDPAVRMPQDMGYPGPADLSEAARTGLRWLPLGVLAAAGGFGVAMATRSTGWAIGATIALVVIMEPFVQVLWPWGSQWLLQTNVAAWMSGGMEWQVSRSVANESMGSTMTTYGTIFISQWRAMAVMVLVVLVVLTVAGTLLRRRDVD